MRTTFLLTALTALVLLAGCRSKQKVKVQATEEETPQLASMVNVADPKLATQLISGFYPVEGGAWRWTAGKFAVLLRPPRNSAEKGATLQVKLAVPEPVIAKLNAVALSATINGKNLPAESYSKAGEYTYSREVPPKVMAGEAVKVEFALDKSLAPNPQDSRELGIVVSAVGFEPK